MAVFDIVLWYAAYAGQMILQHIEQFGVNDDLRIFFCLS